MVPREKEALYEMVALAYQTVEDRHLFPTAVLIRCVHGVLILRYHLEGIII